MAIQSFFNHWYLRIQYLGAIEPTFIGFESYIAIQISGRDPEYILINLFILTIIYFNTCQTKTRMNLSMRKDQSILVTNPKRNQIRGVIEVGEIGLQETTNSSRMNLNKRKRYIMRIFRIRG